MVGLSRSLRVTLLAEYYLPRLGGVEIFVSDLAGALQARGHQVRVVTTTPAAPEGSGSRVPTLETGSIPNFEVVRVPAWNVPAVGIPLSPKLPGRLRDVLSAEPTDIVHVHASVASAGALAGGWAAHTLGLPIVSTLHSVLGTFAWVHRLAHGLTGWGRWPQVVAGVSPAVAAEVECVLERPAWVLPNGVDLAWWSQGRERADRSDPRHLRLVTIQRLKARKRGAALLETLAHVNTRLPAGHSVGLTIVGDGPRRASLEAQAHRLGLDVRFTGAIARQEVREVLGASDVFVLASKEEAFGLAAVEARAVGLPVVAFRTGRLPEIAPEGASGVLVTSDDQMVHALVSLATDPYRLGRLRANSESDPPPFDWSGVVERHEDAYREAVRLCGQR